MTTWLAERVELLRGLAKSGMSASQIAVELGGGLSRNAVIGVCHRKGIPLGADRPVRAGRPAGQSPKPKMARPTKEPRARRAPSIPIDHYLNAPVDEQARDLPPDSSPYAVTLMEIGAGHCRWPLGDPRTPEFRFCGALPHTQKPYCVRHCRMGYQPPRQRSAVVVSDAERMRISMQMKASLKGSRAVPRFDFQGA